MPLRIRAASALGSFPREGEAQRDFASRGCRSDIFRAVVSRLARDLHEHAKQARAATWN